MENTTRLDFIVPLTTQTLNSQSAPIVQTSPYDTYTTIDGWLWNNTINDSYINTTSNIIKWTIFPKNNNGGNIQINPYVNRLYFKCYLYKINSTYSAVPQIVIALTGTYNGNITFGYSGTITNSGYYCFVADIGSNTNTFGQIDSTNTINILPLTFLTSGQSLGTTNLTGNSITSISIVTNTVGNPSYTFILNSISLEMNNGSNQYGGPTDYLSPYKNSGIINNLFTNAVVKATYYENTLSYIYTNFYLSKQAKLVSPLSYKVPTAST